MVSRSGDVYITVRLPAVLFQSRTGDIARDEEENPIGSVRFSRSGMVQRLQRSQKPNQEHAVGKPIGQAYNTTGF